MTTRQRNVHIPSNLLRHLSIVNFSITVAQVRVCVCEVSPKCDTGGMLRACTGHWAFARASCQLD